MKKFYTMSMLAMAVAVVVNGCGGAGSKAVAPSVRSYLGTQAPGDVWSWNISNGTFTATDVTKNYTYSGTESVLPTGFLKLTMQSTTDPGVNVGDVAYAIELPNTALVLEPAGANTQAPITAAALGANPSGPTITYNYVKVPSPTWNSSQAAAGSAVFTITGNNDAVATSPIDINDNPLAHGTLTLTCVNGTLTGTGSNGQVCNGAVTPSGVLALDYGPNNGGIIGVPQPASAISLSAMGNLTFHGFLIKQGQTQEIEATPNGDGTLHGAGYQDVEAGTFQSNGSGVTVTFSAQPSPGLVQMSLATSGGSETILAAVNTVGGKTMVLGFGAGTGSGNPPYNIMLIQE